MSGSGAGGNYVRKFMLTNVSTSSGVVSIGSAPPTAAYGTIGVNDSGGVATEGQNFSKLVFTLEQVGSTALADCEVLILGTFSPTAEQTWWNAIYGGSPFHGNNSYGGPTGVGLPAQGFTNAAAGYWPGVEAFNWQILPAPSDQSTAGGVSNPMTPLVPILTCSLPYTAVRAVVKTAASAGAFSVTVQAIP